jgi:hypothetical protein
MVYYFTSSAVTPTAFIYVGKDKVESEPTPNTIKCMGLMLTRDLDEELIKYGLEEDVWYQSLL